MGVWFSKIYTIAREYRGELTIGLLCFVLASIPAKNSRTVEKGGKKIVSSKLGEKCTKSRPHSGHLRDATALAQELCFQVRVYSVSVLSQVAV